MPSRHCGLQAKHRCVVAEPCTPIYQFSLAVPFTPAFMHACPLRNVIRERSAPPPCCGHATPKWRPRAARYIGATEDDFEWLTDQIVQIANRCCGGRVVSVLEGGYNLRGGIVSAFARSVAAHVRALAEPHSQVCAGLWGRGGGVASLEGGPLGQQAI